MEDYKKGQEDLIKHIKLKIEKLEKSTEGFDIVFDILDFLKDLKPLSKNDSKRNKKISKD